VSGYRDGVVRTGELIAYLLRNVWMRAVGATGGNQMPSFCGLQGSDLKAFTDGHLRWFRRRQVCQRNVPCLTLIYRKWIEGLR
jgi:hypothetical protein